MLHRVNYISYGSGDVTKAVADRVENEENETFVVVKAYAVIHPWTVMVHF